MKHPVLVAALVGFIPTGGWTLRTWWLAWTIHPGHGLNVARR